MRPGRSLASIALFLAATACGTAPDASRSERRELLSDSDPTAWREPAVWVYWISEPGGPARALPPGFQRFEDAAADAGYVLCGHLPVRGLLENARKALFLRDDYEHEDDHTGDQAWTAARVIELDRQRVPFWLEPAMGGVGILRPREAD